MEQTEIVPEIPTGEVRRVVEKHYLFSEVVRILSLRSTNSSLGMSAVRNALLYRVDQMLQDDEASRFVELPAVPVTPRVERAECIYFVKN